MATLATSKTSPITGADDPRRSQIRRYFAKRNFIAPIILIILGAIVLSVQDIAPLGLIPGAIGVIWLLVQIISLSSSPPDMTIDGWFQEDLKRLKDRSMERLNLDATELIRDSLVISGPILWQVVGVPAKELRWRKGKDKYIRFSINNITIIHMTQHKISSYQCIYNFIRGVPLNESDYEYFYKDVVSVASSDVSTNYTLPNNHVMKHAQSFSLAVSSGDRINVIVDSEDLIKFTGGTMPDTGVDTAIRAIRKVLSEKKI